ncbi:Transcriptional regulator MntR [Pseudobythopirellula maris]|uniref:Transcriptional regulator MntR n=1 Tax=Pseudobythopirellula maris TaxID=2527991 RepID=A0A5C5ZP13_9BACT|nr:manganese-binding transcriptional regulator MntR [Pseudobythopirellula maris]TWT88835.1 Transcriptional regulator MntR [Pseudobythopirellula maris]
MDAPAPRQSKRFRRIRDDHAAETAEDYVEAIAELARDEGQCRGADLARHFGVSHVTVTKTVARLAAEGLVETEPYQPIALTKKGERLAEASRKRHEVVLAFLLALGVDEATAQADAEGIEHHVSPSTLKRFKAFLENQPDGEAD